MSWFIPKIEPYHHRLREPGRDEPRNVGSDEVELPDTNNDQRAGSVCAKARIENEPCLVFACVGYRKKEMVRRRRKLQGNAKERASDRRSYVGKWSAGAGRRPATAAAATAAAATAAAKPRTAVGSRAYRYKASAEHDGTQLPAAGPSDRGTARSGRSGVGRDTEYATAAAV